MRVALVVMPFASASRPSLAAGLLKAGLKRRGIGCDVHYLNLEFERRLGLERYQLMAEETATTVLAGDWVFSQAFYGDAFSCWRSYEAEVLADPDWGMQEDHRPAVHAVAEEVPDFLSWALRSVMWGGYDIVGFTSVFVQTLATLCLARAIKNAHPSVLVAAGGGPNFHAPMGRVFMERFPFLDFVANGEGDVAFPALCENLRDDVVEVPAGMLYRERGRVMPAQDSHPEFACLEELPVPDYSEFFRALGDIPPPPRPRTFLPLEASRGCWWGNVSHCTFCGLNGQTMAYRRKSGARVAAEVAELADRYPCVQFMFSDNILDMRAFEDLLPRWIAEGERTPKFFEVKPNLSRPQLALLADAGVNDVQAGIESLSDGMLRVMKKGVTAAQNVAFLRWCQEFGILVRWNIIFGSPREDLSDYAGAAELAKKITHLRPPAACARIRLDRHSPNYRDWREQGFTAIRPMGVYRHLYPFPEEELGRLATIFAYERPGEAAWRAAARPLLEIVTEWQLHEGDRNRAALAVRRHLDGGWDLVDRRFNRPANVARLAPLHLAFLLACDAPASPQRARERVCQAFPATSSKAREAALSFLLERDAVAAIGSSLVTLALMPLDLRAGEISRYQSERTVFHGNTRPSIRVGR